MAKYIESEKALAFQNELEPVVCKNIMTDELFSATKDSDLVAFLQNIPSADVKPVVRGEWKVSRTDYGWNGAEFPTHCKCSECDREVPYQDKGNYCPNCGSYNGGAEEPCMNHR